MFELGWTHSVQFKHSEWMRGEKANNNGLSCWLKLNSVCKFHGEICPATHKEEDYFVSYPACPTLSFWVTLNSGILFVCCSIWNACYWCGDSWTWHAASTLPSPVFLCTQCICNAVSSESEQGVEWANRWVSTLQTKREQCKRASSFQEHQEHSEFGNTRSKHCFCILVVNERPPIFSIFSW